MRSTGPTRMGSASLHGNGHASVPGEEKGIWVCKEVTLPDWLVVLLGKYHGENARVENVQKTDLLSHRVLEG